MKHDSDLWARWQQWWQQWWPRRWPARWQQWRERWPWVPPWRGQGGPADAPAAPPAALPAPPRRCVSVVIPALNESQRIASVVEHVRRDPVVAEVIVVDDSSIDDTAALATAAGARLITSSMLGKGASMSDGANAATQDLVAYVDGDLAGLQPELISTLTLPLREGRADFVKGRFGRAGGRVTELTARPMLRVFFPELATFAQPLGGIVAARRDLLRTATFEDGYGVDVGLLIDAHRAGARLAEADVGQIENDSQALPDLALMANEVARIIFNRARTAGRLHVDQIASMYEAQRQAASSIDYVLTRRRGRRRVLLLDLDGTITPQHYIEELARATGLEATLALRVERSDDERATRRSDVAGVFRFVHRQQFERVARAMPLRDGVIEWVRQMRRAGFMVGVASEGWYVAAEILRRRVFADFALAHTLQFDGDVCTGEVNLNAAFRSPRARGGGESLCKSHVVQHFREHHAEPRVDEVWAVGNDASDLGMLRAADRAFVIDPKTTTLARGADATRVDSFEALWALVPKATPGAPD